MRRNYEPKNKAADICKGGGEEKAMMELNRIYNEDNLETCRRMPDGFIDLIVTSPPYDDLRVYKGYEFDVRQTATYAGQRYVSAITDMTKRRKRLGGKK